MRLIHYHENNMGEIAPMIQIIAPMIQIISHQVPPPTHGDYESTIQDEIWMGGTQTQTISTID